MNQLKTEELNRNLHSLPENTQLQLLPAFLDMRSGKVYLSQFANGDLAPVHVYDGLPDKILLRNDMKLVSGFILNGQFLTHQQAAEKLSDTRVV